MTLTSANRSGVSKPRHKRASFVCQKCHRLKMKCDITTHGIPCSRCEKRGGDSCELFLSKKRSGFDTAKALMSLSNGGLQRAESEALANRQPISVSEEIDNLQGENEKNAFGPSVPQTTDVEHLESFSTTIDPFSQSCNSKNNDSHGEIEEVPRHSPELSLGSPFGRFGQLEWLPSLAPSPVNLQMDGGTFNTISSGNYNTNYNFERGSVLSNRRDSMYLSVYKKDSEGIEFTLDMAGSRDKLDRQRLTFLGESCPLSLLLRRLQDSGHIYMTTTSKEDESEPSSQNGGVNSGSLDWQSSSDASSSPSSDSTANRIQKGSLQELLRVYFHVIHPFYPIINRRWFAEKYASQTVPPVLMNAICFAACYHCDSSAIHNAGFFYRQDAKRAFYDDAKRLFDDDSEPDVVVVLQAAFLLSFHGGKPRRVWSNRTWLSVAVTIAEDLGMHRSTMRSGHVDRFDKSHLRIIWWGLVMRDIMTSITMGRPHKICELRCDVDPLTIEDFNLVDKDPEDTDLFGKSDPDYYHLLIELCKTNMLIWKVGSSRYDPRSDPRYDSAVIRNELEVWRDALPECIDWAKRPNSVPAIYMAMIHHHLMIHITRPRMVDSEVVEVCSLESSVHSANELVSQVIKLASTELLAIPQDVYPLFVTAMAILIADYRSNQTVVSKLQLQICIMTLNQAKECWDHASWLKSLFERMLEENSASLPPNHGGLLDSIIV